MAGKDGLVLLIVISVTLFSLLHEAEVQFPAVLPGFITALGLATIGIYYTAIERIRWVYLPDRFGKGIIFLGWIIVYKRSPFQKAGRP